ncbi:hypothetical protein K7432_016411 [Basidiobolus ranarum]|uniref:Uncharacterized protein n=1 Tax=Basidiobolus ranarum TaxID=34480 RepID=A0ABR2WET7_9FUNG
MCSGEPGLEEVLIFVLFPIFTAATVHLTNTTTKDMRLASLAKKNLTKNMILLSKIRTRWGSAGKYYIVLRELLTARNINIDEHVEDSTSNEPSICSSAYENNKSTTPISHPTSQLQYPDVVLATNQTSPFCNSNLPPSSIPNMTTVAASNITASNQPTMASYQSNTIGEGPAPLVENPGISNAYTAPSHKRNPQPQGNLPNRPGAYVIAGSITNVGFDPSAPSNTLSEMTVNNQHLISQLSNSNGAPIWNVPLSFDFDEWNEYVGQYSRNFGSSVPMSNGGPNILLAPTTPPPPISHPTLSTVVHNATAQLNYQSMTPAAVPSKYDPVVKARPWQLYNARG